MMAALWPSIRRPLSSFSSLPHPHSPGPSDIPRAGSCQEELPFPFSYPQAMPVGCTLHPDTVVGEPPPPLSPSGHPRRAPRPGGGTQTAPGTGVPFLSIQRRFPGPPRRRKCRGFPVRRRLLSWAAGCSVRGGGSTRAGDAAFPCRAVPRALSQHPVI